MPATPSPERPPRKRLPAFPGLAAASLLRVAAAALLRVPAAALLRVPAAALLLLLSACAAAPAPARTAGPGDQPVSPELALLTFDSAWSRIAHTHYDTAYAGVDWAAVRVELRPAAGAAGTLGELRRVIVAMLARLGESHYALIPAEAASAVSGAGPGGDVQGDMGAELRLAGGELVVWRVDADGPAAAAGVAAGWRVESVDGERVAPRVAALAALAADQQRTARTRLLYQLNALLLGGPGTTATLRLTDGSGVARDVRVVRRERPGELVRFGNLPPTIAEFRHERLQRGDGCVGIMRLNVWMLPLMQQLDRAVDESRACAGVIIDLRGNPGGVAGMVMGAAGHFLADTLPLGYMRMRTTQLRFKANPRLVTADGRRVQPYAGRLAILVDEMSASTSEFFAAALQGVGRARVFGVNTAGQALPAVLVRLPTDDVLMHVLADFTGPGGVRIEGRGVVPDVTLPVTREDLLRGVDAPLERALDWIAGAAGATSLPTRENQS